MNIAEKTLQLKQDFDDVYEAGKKAENDAFWDCYLATPKKTGNGYCLFAGVGWNENTKIPYKIDFITNGYNMFMYSGNIPKTELAKIDFSKFTSYFPVFNYSRIQHIPELDTRGVSALGALFAYVTSLISVDNIILRDDGSQTNLNLFNNNVNLEEVGFTGIMGQNGFNVQWSTKLTHESLMSIIKALKDYSADTSGTEWIVTIGSVNKAKLTTEELNIAYKKGWQVN